MDRVAGAVTDNLTESEVGTVKDLATEICHAFADHGLHCVLILAGHGCDLAAYLEGTQPYVPQMLGNALKAAQARNARLAN